MERNYNKRICELCGKEFTPKGSKDKYCKSPVVKICSVCGNEFTSICHPKASNTCDNPDCKRRAGSVASHKAIRRLCRVCGQPFDATAANQQDCNRKLTRICCICGESFETKCSIYHNENTCGNSDCSQSFAVIQMQKHYLATTKLCAICGKSFHPINNKQTICGNTHTVVCKICGKLYEVDAKYNEKEIPQYCSDECRQIRFLQRSHPNTPETIEKIKQTKVQRYGKNYGHKVWQKANKTYQERTGYSHPIYNIETHYKRANTRSKIAAKDGKKFDSQYECQIYNFLLDIPGIQIHSQIPVDFQYNGNPHKTWIDFKINDKLIEVKGEHLLSGVYDKIGIPISTKLNVYNDNKVIVITNNTQRAKEILNNYNNIIGIDISLFDNKLTRSEKIQIWRRIELSAQQNIKFIETKTLISNK